MNKLKTIKLLIVSLLVLLIFISSKTFNTTSIKEIGIQQDSLKWDAPESANNLLNPFESNDENIAEGKLIYRKSCRSCHGKKGDGQGSGAADISTVVTDFTNASFIEQTDGSIFWKIKEGRNDMKPFGKKLESDDIWLVVLYIKTFSTTPK